jgi:hypothetical protein
MKNRSTWRVTIFVDDGSEGWTPYDFETAGDAEKWINSGNSHGHPFRVFREIDLRIVDPQEGWFKK